MEQRLLPINAIISLATSASSDPAVLKDLGFELAGLEIPVATAAGLVKIDIVLYRQRDRCILAIEAKGGQNIEDKQAVKYQALRPDDAIRASGISVRERGDRQLHIAYCGLQQHIARFKAQLSAVSVNAALLGVSSQAISIDTAHANEPGAHPLASVAGRHRLRRGIPRIIKIDHESPSEEMRTAVVAEVVATMAHPEQPHISVNTLAERICPHIVIFGSAARQRLRRRVDEICRRLPSELEGKVSYLARSEGRDSAALHILDSPERADPRGRTQRYQAIDRGNRRPRATRDLHPGQGELDLFEELDSADQIEDNDARRVTTSQRKPSSTGTGERTEATNEAGEEAT